MSSACALLYASIVVPLVMVTVFTSLAVADGHTTGSAPEAEAVARDALAAIAGGDVAKVIALHTDGARRPIAAQLSFGSGAEPSLAFLVRRLFDVAGVTSSQWPRDLGIGGIPWSILCPDVFECLLRLP